MLKIKNIYMMGRKIETGAGNLIRLWKDPINGLIPFQDQYPRLFEICNYPTSTLDKRDELDDTSIFRRRLTPELSKQWEDMRAAVNRIHLDGRSDRVFWGLNQSGKFTTKSVYKMLEVMNVGERSNFKKIPTHMQDHGDGIATRGESVRPRTLVDRKRKR